MKYSNISYLLNLKKSYIFRLIFFSFIFFASLFILIFAFHLVSSIVSAFVLGSSLILLCYYSFCLGRVTELLIICNHF